VEHRAYPTSSALMAHLQEMGPLAPRNAVGSGIGQRPTPPARPPPSRLQRGSSAPATGSGNGHDRCFPSVAEPAGSHSRAGPAGWEPPPSGRSLPPRTGASRPLPAPAGWGQRPVRVTRAQGFAGPGSELCRRPARRRHPARSEAPQQRPPRVTSLRVVQLPGAVCGFAVGRVKLAVSLSRRTRDSLSR